MDEYGLTPRELEMLKLHATHTRAAVAAMTGTTVPTVRNHLRNAYRKLGVGGVSDGTMARERAMLKLGWLQVPE